MADQPNYLRYGDIVKIKLLNDGTFLSSNQELPKDGQGPEYPKSINYLVSTKSISNNTTDDEFHWKIENAENSPSRTIDDRVKMGSFIYLRNLENDGRLSGNRSGLKDGFTEVITNEQETDYEKNNVGYTYRWRVMPTKTEDDAEYVSLNKFYFIRLSDEKITPLPRDRALTGGRSGIGEVLTYVTTWGDMRKNFETYNWSFEKVED